MPDGYESFYREFDSPLMRQLRHDAYGEDIGQHSWVTANQLREDVDRLRLSRTSRLIDLGCGACGPLTFILGTVGCSGTGVELSPSALNTGRARAASLGVDALLSVRAADLNQPLPFERGSFDTAMAIDVVLHVRDRARLFHDVATLLAPGGRFLLTDAGVITGSVSNDEVRARSVNGYTQFVPPGWNEALLRAAGSRLLEIEDRTRSVTENAVGRLTAMQSRRVELCELWGAADFEQQRQYLQTVIELSRRGAVSRFMYLTEVS